MRTIILFIACLYATGAFAQKNNPKKPENQIRRFWFVMLTNGPDRNQDSITAAQIQKEHLSNINRLYYEGKLKVAGPFEDNDKWLGIFIFDCPTREEVEELLKSDLAISSGRLAYEITGWYTSPTGSFIPGKPNVKWSPK